MKFMFKKVMHKNVSLLKISPGADLEHFGGGAQTGTSG